MEQEREAVVYLHTASGIEQRIASVPLCQVPQPGDKMKIEEIWHTVASVEGADGAGVCNVHVK
ncbi:hypothetical protein [Tumebacillus flagellatus]|uniref:Uncharacterized protein n=1 Tax=Tumebacillus flagellatus TaxID=1157490 RepID=A0A074LW68_9BACL|nr:hypothetical protein [Tumebacillus flagellatus]KEO84298.1 hypothetical protein EL26_05895 [Tumebacillus flagellatus]